MSKYIDDIIGTLSNSWEEHKVSVHKVLKILQDNNFTVNPLKCEWAVQETDWLGYWWLTPTGLTVKPWKKKFDALLALKRPASIIFRTPVPSLARRANALYSVELYSGRQNVKSPSMQLKPYWQKKRFFNFRTTNKPFHIYTDASDRQLEAPSFYKKRLNQWHFFGENATGEKELLSIVEKLSKSIAQCYSAAYGPIFHYIKEKHNTAADAFSGLSFSERQSTHPLNPSASDFPEFTGEDFPVEVDFHGEVIEFDFNGEVYFNGEVFTGDFHGEVRGRWIFDVKWFSGKPPKG
ncbi:hypothetical protein IV203_024210 [Nitzschia inconspicua]|uniref:Uncharacterized protein n=1 Tax=Nitzschia inconspicua TaxID=303405 RepID=A0A9K3KBF2_9STRA|nr:hypothetical protein IV203_024210 [Nitzschia inconspicua]